MFKELYIFDLNQEKHLKKNASCVLKKRNLAYALIIKHTQEKIKPTLYVQHVRSRF